MEHRQFSEYRQFTFGPKLMRELALEGKPGTISEVVRELEKRSEDGVLMFREERNRGEKTEYILIYLVGNAGVVNTVEATKGVAQCRTDIFLRNFFDTEIMSRYKELYRENPSVGQNINVGTEIR